nr:tRNA lysidine(34) synthetase TilS [Rhodovulum imhoffii]
MAQTVRAALGQPPAHLGVAVSGGGDSLALLLLLREATPETRLHAVTVDHDLRPESAEEAACVGRICAGLGVVHRVLRWQGWDGQGNLQDAARRARYGLIRDWARGTGLTAVALGHTADDQAETLLLRLARGSGVDGLSAMAAQRDHGGLAWLRPMLTLRRADLRLYLQDRGQVWIDDPSNEDARFDRVRARRLMEAMTPLGLTAGGLIATAGRMSMAREALDWLADHAAHAMTPDRGDVVVDLAALSGFPRETRLRLLAEGLCYVSSAIYRPRFSALEAADRSVTEGRAHTLHGVLMRPCKAGVRLIREYNAVREVRAVPGRLWDRRWRLKGPPVQGLEVRALGESGLAVCEGWRETGLPRESLLASPALWAGGQLVAAPLAGLENGWQAALEPVAGLRLGKSH